MEEFHNCADLSARSYDPPKLQNGTRMNTPKTEQEPSTQEGQDRQQTTNGEQPPSVAQSQGQSDSVDKKSDQKKSSAKTKQAKPLRTNNVRKMRMERMMSKAELARRAGLSSLTIDRVEKGMACRMDTKRKILEALGLTPSDRVIVFGEDD